MLLPLAPRDLAARLGDPDAPLIVDVCLPEDVAAAPHRIPGAIRIAHRDAARPEVGRLAGPHAEAREIVVACQRGLKLSLGAAARLHAEGARARVLAGGMAAWRAAALPVTPDAALPASSLWVVAEDPAADAALCHWILHRFAPPGARLLVVPADSRAAVADHFDAHVIESPRALVRGLGLNLPALHDVLGECAATGALVHLLAQAAARADPVCDGGPTLALLDLALASRRAGAPE